MTTTTAASLEWPIARVRQTYVDFFVGKGHTFWPSCPVVPHDDPTLLFNNAGMNQFKALFLGTADPGTEFGQLRRAANSQLCIRAGGKHNDLDDVGRDTYHHTFFEMLGNWSFGDYFKKDAIAWAWELLTEVYKLPADRLYATYFEGDPANGLEVDAEARDLWLQFLPADHVVPGNAKDNFWEMGDVGPCGPCSELHFDRIGGRNAADIVNKDDPMVIEIWNLVFIQYERVAGGKLVLLPSKHVDTGMGLERLASIMQGVTSNYDSDAWTPIFAEIQRVTGFPTSYAEIRDQNGNDATVAYRVVADHIRCLTTALADGAMPDNVGRGFVLRRIIRRAVRYGVQFLGAKFGFFHQLVDAVSASLGGFFPHLQDPKVVHRVRAILEDEEMSFARTWEIGLREFNKAVADTRARKSNVISGADAFVLHDRHGFPVDLTCLLAEKEGMTVDTEGFKTEMETNQNNSNKVAAAKTFLNVHQIEELKKKGVPQTQDEAKYTWAESAGEIVAIFDKTNEKFLEFLPGDNGLGEEGVGLILNSTNFYAESGGQIYDTGRIVAASDCVFVVRRVYSIAGYVVHVGNLEPGTECPLPVSAGAQLQVDYERRTPIAANHTSTHELNWVLRRILEDEKEDALFEVNQKGSLVTEEVLRFDFSYNAKLTNEELGRVEALLNDRIAAGLEVFRAEVPLELARTIAGMRPMFGEKYPDPVSVISVGAPVSDVIKNPGDEKWKQFSIEFCGGTHLKNLRDAGQAVILSEEALMKGVRRITVATRAQAMAAIASGAALQAELDELVKLPPSAASMKAVSVLGKKVNDSSAPLIKKNALREAIEEAIKAINTQLKALAAGAKDRAAEEGAAAGAANTEPLVVLRLPQYGAEREAIQSYCDAFMKASPSPVGIFAVGDDGEKALAIVQLPAEHTERKLSAVPWIKAAIGKGGGKPFLAQSGLPSAGVDAAVEKAIAEMEVMKKSL